MKKILILIALIVLNINLAFSEEQTIQIKVDSEVNEKTKINYKGLIKSKIINLLQTGDYKTKYKVIKKSLSKFRKKDEQGKPGEFIETEFTPELKTILINNLQSEVDFWQNKDYKDKDKGYHWKSYKELLSAVANLKDESTIPSLIDSLNTPCGLKIVEDTLVEFGDITKQPLIIKLNSKDTKWKHRYTSVLYRIMQNEKGANSDE